MEYSFESKLPSQIIKQLLERFNLCQDDLELFRSISGESMEYQQWLLLCHLYRAYQHHICRNIYQFRICCFECFFWRNCAGVWSSQVSLLFYMLTFSFVPSWGRHPKISVFFVKVWRCNFPLNQLHYVVFGSCVN